MSKKPGNRIEASLSALVSALLPALPDEQEHLAEQRKQKALKVAKDILKEHESSNGSPDISQIADLIKKKFWQEQNAPDKAVQFGNLYSRLLSVPILSRKQSILHLLHLIAESKPESVEDDSSARSELPQKQGSDEGEHAPSTSGPPRMIDQNRPILNDITDGRLNQRSSEPAGKETKAPHRPLDRRKNGPFEEAASTRDVSAQVQHIDIRDNAEESDLLRDLPFTLQGLSSANLVFSSKSTLLLPTNLPLPLISLLHSLAEPSLLYCRLSEFVQSRNDGLVSQSLQAAVGVEMRSYLGLIGTLEGEIRRTLSSAKDQEESMSRQHAVTLKRCVVWTRDATLGLRLMSLMAEESKTKKGGQLISLIHSYSTSHGDPFVSNFAERILSHLSRPFYDMLRQWIYDGELSDPYQEFFVIENEPDEDTRDLDPRRSPASSVWESKYKLDNKLVPSIITEDFAKKIFLIGKSLNFLRYSCGDSAWVQAYSKDSSKELRYGDTENLETSIDEAYKTTMARLIHLMKDKFKLFDHLHALRKYLLLGQGDFVALLMESLASNLDRPAGSQYRHTLTAQLEYAIRGSNAQYDSPDVLRRLDARLLELSHGDIGWDVFTLEYKVDAPVDVVITAQASTQYLKIFNFLWRVKRAEFALGTTWRWLTTGARGILGTVNDKVGRDWKAARGCIAEMVHFINQLQYYILFEVIEASWDQLQEAIAKPGCTLDELIAAHTKYLDSITHKGLLGASRSALTGSRDDSFMSQLHYILKVMLAYKDAVDGLYSFSVAEFTRRQEFAAKIETRFATTKLGTLDSDADDLNSPHPGDSLKGTKRFAERETDSPLPQGLLSGLGEDQMLPSLQKRLRELSADYRSRLTTLLGDLLVQPDPDMKFLGVVMNFNDVYRPQRRKRRDPKERGEKKLAPAESHGGKR